MPSRNLGWVLGCCAASSAKTWSKKPSNWAIRIWIRLGCTRIRTPLAKSSRRSGWTARVSSSPPRSGIHTWSTRRPWSRWRRFCAICRPSTLISCSSTAPVRACRWSEPWPLLKRSTRPVRPRALASAISALSRLIGLGPPPACRSAPIRWNTTCAATAKGCGTIATPTTWC